MITLGICLAMVVYAGIRAFPVRQAPLDREEIMFLRRLSDRLRREQAIPFD